MKQFCSLNLVKNLINEVTCCKNSEKPTCINLILTNQPTLSKHSTVLETRLSDFHLLVVTEPKTCFKNASPHNITYQNYNDAFRPEIQNFCSVNEADLGLFKE